MDNPLIEAGSQIASHMTLEELAKANASVKDHEDDMLRRMLRAGERDAEARKAR
jgi:hypothetical protein